MAVDLDAIETALAKMTPGPWHNYFERVIADCYEVATCHAKRPQEVYDAAGIVLLRNHGDAMAAEIRTLRADLAAARLDVANARSVAVEAIGLAETWAISLSGDDRLGRHLQTVSLARIDEIKARLASPADFAARVTAALDRLVEVAASEFPGSAKVDAARAEVDAAIGVGRG